MKLLRATPNKEVNSPIPVRLSAGWVQTESLSRFRMTCGVLYAPIFLGFKSFRIQGVYPNGVEVIAIAAIADKLPGDGRGLFELDADQSA